MKVVLVTKIKNLGDKILKQTFKCKNDKMDMFKNMSSKNKPSKEL